MSTETKEIYKITDLAASGGTTLEELVGREVTVSNSDSIEVTRNTKGYVWSVKMYFAPGEYSETISKIVSANNMLVAEYGSRVAE